MVQTQRELSVPTSPTPSHTPESNLDLRRLVREARAGRSEERRVGKECGS